MSANASNKSPTGPSTKLAIMVCNLTIASWNLAWAVLCCSCFARNSLADNPESLRAWSWSLFKSAASFPYLLIASCFINISAISSLLKPKASANDFWARTFIFWKSFKEPTWLDISLVKVNWSPDKAAARALSKLSCLPVINSAFNSFSIDDSQFSNDSPILSIWSNVNPNFLASTTACPIAFGLPWNLTKIPALNLDTSCNISLLSKWVPVVCWAKNAASLILSV